MSSIRIMSYSLDTCSVLYIQYPNTHTGLNKARYSYTQLYRAIHSSTGLYTALQGYTQLYRAIHSYIEIYTAIQGYTELYRAIHSYIEIYTAIQGYTELYRAIQGRSSLGNDDSERLLSCKKSL